jgi:cellobiose phosphorylase
MDHRDILLNLYLGTEMEGGPANLYLRRHGSSVESVPLLGPCSPSSFHADKQGMTATGEWRGIGFHISLILSQSAPAWFWHVALENTRRKVETVDLIYAQDLALAHYGMVRLNEYYVCHYVDHTPLTHSEQGMVLASRQNQSMGGRNPWAVIGALGRSVGYATDAMQFHGLETRAGRSPAGLRGLPGVRLQHEHSMVAIQDAPVQLDSGGKAERGFFGWFEPDHPEASSAADLQFVEKAMRLPEAVRGRARSGHAGRKPVGSVFTGSPLLNGLDLTDAELTLLYGSELREEERVDGQLISFFAGDRRHVALKAKELKVLRPHVHILRTGSGLIPEESSLTSTAWMGGVFHSMVTQGHVSINRFLSTVHSYLSLLRENGQRIFVEIDGRRRLLDIPSAFEMGPQHCRWIYKHEKGLIEVQSTALTERHELTLSAGVVSGSPVRLLVSHHVAVNGDDGSDAVPVQYVLDGEGVFIRAVPDSDVGRRFPDGGFRISPLPGTVIEKIGGDELLFSDGRSRNQPFLCIETGPTTAAGFRLTGHLISETSVGSPAPEKIRLHESITSGLRIHPPSAGPLKTDAARIGEILPWFIHNALIHYLSPRGSEQYTGGGWGTRDVSQGPVEMLLAMGEIDPVRDLLSRVFRAQNPDGDWPQWFMFFDRERNIRPGDSHGDIVFWPLLALAQYLIASEDRGFLDEEVVFFHPDGDERAERASVWRHVERAFGIIGRRVIPGTSLAAYGNGDWNDSLQPVQPEMREHLCSTWTVTLHYQTLVTLALALNRLGMKRRAARLETAALKVRDDFKRFLMVDETLAGFACFPDEEHVEYLLHPRDRATGITYSLLPMIHAIINDLLCPDEARKHLEIIKTHLLGPDGARLFNRPPEYRGGPQRYFQRAESSSYFGREIGLMYTHAHLRYAEALARYGDVHGFFRALCQVNPIGIRDLVPSAALRQSNCYFSSSDAAFADRYQASAEYGRVQKGEIPLEGGWRVYSSGAGIWTKLVLHSFLGLRREKSVLIIDPMIPQPLDGMRVEMKWGDRMVEVIYRIEAKGFGPAAVHLNGHELPFTRSPNPYRTGPAEIPMKAVQERFVDSINRMTVFLD